MIVEYEPEQDAEPVRVVLRQWDQAAEDWGQRRPLGRMLPPAPGTVVSVNYEPHKVQCLRFNSYPDNPSLDWVEVFVG